MTAGPLEKLRVLDLSRLLPGPFATLVLADLGASVDRIEEMGGDYLRHVPPSVNGTSGMFLALNRNKRSACIDLKQPAGRETLLRLLPHYDVVLEQFRPGVLARLGLGHEELLLKNPRLILCALTGYGQTGPDSQRAGHDLNYLARAGLLGFQGGSPPAVPGFQLADIGGALWSVIGILAALVERTATGRGKILDVSMVESAMGFGLASLGLLLAGHVPQPGGEALTGGLAAYQTYGTKDDRFVTLAALEPKFWGAFCRAVGMETDMTALLAGPHQVPLREKLASLFQTRTLREWEKLSREHDFCLEPVRSPSELQADPQHVARKVFFEVPSPAGNLLQWRTPLADPDRAHRVPPAAGEHTRAILEENGFSSAEVDELFRTRAVS